MKFEQYNTEALEGIEIRAGGDGTGEGMALSFPSVDLDQFNALFRDEAQQLILSWLLAASLGVDLG